MTIANLLYLVDLITNINNVCTFIIIVSTIITIVGSFCWIMTNDNYSKDVNGQITIFMKNAYKKCYIPIIATFIFVIVPSQKTMYLMLGASYLQSSNLPKKVSEALEIKLDDVISQLKEKK